MTLVMRAMLLLALSAGCGQQRERLDYVPVTSQAMNGAHLSYSVYTPPDFSADEELPLVLFLHGGGDEPQNFERYGVAERLDEAIAEGRMPRVVVALPQGDNGFWINWWDETRRYEDWLLMELLPEVQRSYHTRRCPEDCHIMGVSMGGAGTLRFALRHPEHFASATVLSGPVFDTERMLEFIQSRLYSLAIPTHRIFGPPRPKSEIAPDDPFVVWQQPEDLHVRLFFGWAERDRSGIKESNEALRAHLEEAGIPHHAEEFEGEHKWYSWAPVIERAIAVQVGGEGPGSDG